MLANGRLYHPAPFATYGLVKSSIADALFPLFTFNTSGYPCIFLWKGKEFKITDNIRRIVEPE